MAKNSSKVKKNTKKENNFKRLAENRYAKFQYAISETIEAGIELLGTEVKSIRNGKANLRDGYCSYRDGEILLLNVLVFLFIILILVTFTLKIFSIFDLRFFLFALDGTLKIILFCSERFVDFSVTIGAKILS